MYLSNETVECICLIQDYCQTKALILASFWQSRARGMTRNKRNKHKLDQGLNWVISVDPCTRGGF